MSSGPNMPRPQSVASSDEANAAMENFVRLQDAQDEFLKWLDAGEKNRSLDRYNYKKVR